jgi:Flp pilus assembly pilin Flp
MTTYRAHKGFARLRRDRRSVAALEFALIAPVMVVLAGGVYDICQAVLIYNEVTSTAATIVASASSGAVNLDGSTALSYDEAQQAESGIWADIPSLRSGRQFGAVKSVTLSAIDFEPPATCKTGSNCNPYTAQVMWSVAYAGGSSGASFAPNLRTCAPTGAQSDGLGGEVQVSGSTGVNGSNFTYTLPTAAVSSYSNDPTGPAPILVADVEFSYAPVFGVLKSPITFVASSLWPVRSVKPTGPLVSGGVTYQPLSQQFTKIYGVVSGNAFTPYAAPTSSGVSTTTPEADAVAGTYCASLTQSNPTPYTTSSS